MAYRTPLVLTLFFAVFVLLSGVALAHEEGLTLTRSAGGYYIDIDYDEKAIAAERNGQFTFRLYEDETRENPAGFTSTWVRVEKQIKEGDIKTLFTGSLAVSEFSVPNMQYVFSEEGTYLLHVRYYHESEEIAASSFTLSVESSAPWYSLFFEQTLWLGALTGAVLSWFVLGFYARKRATRTM